MAYVPGSLETDPKKQNASLRSLNDGLSTAQSDIVTNTSDIAAISAAYVSSIAGNSGAFTLSHGLTNSTNDLQLNMTFVQGTLFGLTLSTAGGSNSFGIAAGYAVDDSPTDFMLLGSALTKTNSSWTVGTGNGALDTGVIASGWYHVFLIKRPDTGVVDVLISLSATAPTMPANYTLKRRIGSMLSNVNTWMLFHQRADEFLWDARVAELTASTISATTATLQTLTVPTNIQVNALFNARLNFITNSTALLFTSPDESDQAAAQALSSLITNTAATNAAGHFDIRTNTSGQIRWRASATANTLSLSTYGWIDTRGRIA